MNQTEIDELRERIDAAISTVCNGMAAMSIPADPRDVDLVLADCAKALAALADAEAERSEARSLLLNGIQTNGDSLAFLEHVRREHAAVVAERDAIKATLAKRAESERAWCELATERGAKLAALVEAMDYICTNTSDVATAGVALAALAAAKVQP